MIELKGISQNKDNQVIIQDINLKFNRTGLIFFVDGSDTENETLLNIIAGIERASSGELIINGKSSNNLNEEELSAYRNTYVGIIKNEKQFLESASISKNVRLGLEMQEKKIGNKELRKILDAVGLTDISSSKILRYLTENQKQQVALARALVKSPTVIVAYEPTKYLNTIETKQYYNLLKRVSVNRVVIVATRDKDTAKDYGDRCFFIDKKTVVDDSKVEIVENIAENFGIIPSNIPFSIINSNAQVALTHNLLLFLFTFIALFLGLLLGSTFLTKGNLDLKDVYVQTMIDNKHDETIIVNDVSDDKIESIKKETNVKFTKEYQIAKNGQIPVIVFPYFINRDNVYYVDSMPVSFVSDLENVDVFGRKPTNHNEIVISKYIADQIVKNGLNANTNQVYSSYEEILNKNIELNNLGIFKIVGIKNDDLSKYEEFKNTLFQDLKEDKTKTYEDLQYDIKTKFKRIYVNESFFNNLGLKNSNVINKTIKISNELNTYKINKLGYLNDDIEVITEDGVKTISSLNDNEIIISEDVLNDIFDDGLRKRYEEFKKETGIIDSNSYYQFMIDFIKERALSTKTIKTNLANNNISNLFYDYKIVGISKGNTSTILYKKEIVEGLFPKELRVTGLFSNIFSDYDIETVKSRYSDSYLKLNEIYTFLNKYDKYVAIALILVGIFFLTTLINKSIRALQNTINVYKLLGATNKTVKKIFTTEIFQFAILLGIATLFASKFLIKFINSSFNNYFNSNFIFYNFDIKNVVIIILGAAIISFITYLLTLLKFDKKV